MKKITSKNLWKAALVFVITMLFAFCFESHSVAQSYCDSALNYYGCGYIGAIDNFHLSNINHVGTGCTGETGIANYTTDTCLLAQGEPYMLTYSTNSSTYSSQYDQLGVWIDFNDDFDFDDAGEYLSPANLVGLHSFLINIPLTAPLGNHRMRLRVINDWSSTAMDSSKSCYSYFYYNETEDYTVNIVAPPPCPSVNSVSVSNIQLHSADVNFTCNGCTDAFIVEYGLPGFTPGVGSTAGVGGTIVNVANTSALPLTISGLNSSTYYDVYVRKDCGTNGYSSNYGPVNFITKYDVCGTLTTINCGDTVVANIPTGRGAFDSTACGNNTGKELLYSFTPTVSGIYTLTIINSDWTQAAYNIKEAASGCNTNGWNCAQLYSWQVTWSAPITIILDTLQAGTTYLLCMDASNKDNGANHTFKIDCYQPFNPCDTTSVITCGVPQDVVIPAGLGAYTIYNMYDSYYFGREKIYSFTPSITGIYTLTINSSNASAAFKYKKASYGCNANNWHSITGVGSYLYSPLVTLIGTLVAGTEYYFLIDDWSIVDLNLNFQIDCYSPPAPCSSIQTITCGSIVNASIPKGAGAFDMKVTYSYGTTELIGREAIYQFTPTTTGKAALHIINQTSPNWDNYFYYYIKPASGGCSALGWTRLGEGSAYPGYYDIPFQLDSGVSYYLMIDSKMLDGNTQQFEITCPEPWNPCVNLIPLNCNDTVTATIPSGVGVFDVSSPSWGYYKTMGRELIYSFTATLSGSYAINLLATDYKQVKYSLKDAAAGCNEIGWNVLQVTSWGGDIYIPVILTAGHTYYLMLDATDYTGAVRTFSLLCTYPADPCSSIISIGCDTDVSFVNNHGLGVFDPVTPPNDVTAPGRETIFEFTATVTGTHYLSVTSVVTPYYSAVAYYIKKASLGCNNDNWYHIGNMYYAPSGAPIPIILEAGTSYYILADSYTDGQTFKVVCPQTTYDYCSTITTIPACGQQFTVTIPQGVGAIMPPLVNYNYSSVSAGKEMLYSFTPTVSGYYGLVMDSIAFNYTVNHSLPVFFIKQASDGCNANNWQFFSSQRTPFPLQAGSMYYIMADGYDTLDMIVYMRIICPSPDPCINIINFADCGSYLTDSIPVGINQYNMGGCGTNYMQQNSPVGNAHIYSYTPSVNGIKTLGVYSLDYGYGMRFFIKKAYQGCSSDNWICCDQDPYYSKVTFPYQLDKDTTYYIMMVNAYAGYYWPIHIYTECYNATTQYADKDGDGYGDDNDIIYSDWPTFGYTYDGGDCNDLNAAIHPFAPELCDGIDNDCDGLIDENGFNITASISNIACKATATGAVAITATGVGPFTFNWTNGSTLQNLNGLFAGTYTVYASNAAGCSKSLSCSLLQPATFLTISLNKTNVRCHGKQTGKITVIANGGWGSYSYVWSNGSTIPTINNLNAGTYTCTITDVGGCVKTISATVTQGNQLIVNVVPVSATSAAANVSGGMPPYSYHWKTAPAQFTQTATGLIPGNTYKVKVSDSKNCTVVQSFTMPVLKNIFENRQSNSLIVFPNPSDGNVQIIFKENNAGAGFINVYDLSGRIVFEKHVAVISNIIPVNLNQLSSGIYYLEFKSENTCLRTKIILE